MNRKSYFRTFAGVATCLSLAFASVANACTSFLLPASDGGFVYARTLEFGLDIESSGISIGRGVAMKGTGIDGKAGSGLSWTSKYAAIGASGLNLPILVDGFNEKGLAGGMLYAPNISQFQEVSPAESSRSIASYEMLVYALTNFATVDEAREGFRKIKVNQSPQQAFKGVVPLHMTLHDTSGKSIVIEYIGGELQIHDNPTSVLTNAPHFSWHLNNLGNYAGLSTRNPAPIKVGDASFGSPSSGGGMTGLPGDMSSPSRFVRAFLLSQNAPKKLDSRQQVATAFHILNNFDIAPGMISLGGGFGGSSGGYEITYWSAVSDLKNQIFYIRTFGNPSVQAIRMADIDPTIAEIRHFDLNNPWNIHVISERKAPAKP